MHRKIPGTLKLVGCMVHRRIIYARRRTNVEVVLAKLLFQSQPQGVNWWIWQCSISFLVASQHTLVIWKTLFAAWLISNIVTLAVMIQWASCMRQQDCQCCGSTWPHTTKQEKFLRNPTATSQWGAPKQLAHFLQRWLTQNHPVGNVWLYRVQQRLTVLKYQLSFPSLSAVDQHFVSYIINTFITSICQ